MRLFFSTLSGSKSDATLVYVVFGAPDPDEIRAGAWQNNTSLLCGVIIGSLAALLLLILGIALCLRSATTHKRRRARRGGAAAHSSSADSSCNVLQYAAFRGIDNQATSHHRLDTSSSNHYHDPSGHHHHLATHHILGSDASVSSGRGSADDDGGNVILTHHQTSGHYCTGDQRSRRCFPGTMPDSGLPDVDSSGDYCVKVASPPSAPGSHESIHRFDDELAPEEQYFHQCQERRSHNSSSSGSGFEQQRQARRLPPVRSSPLAGGNETFDYLMWLPEYGPMAAVYAEIAEFPRHPSSSERSSESHSQNPYSCGGSSSTASVFFSKNSSQTTLPSIPAHLMRSHFPATRLGHGNLYPHHLNSLARK